MIKYFILTAVSYPGLIKICQFWDFVRVNNWIPVVVRAGIAVTVQVSVLADVRRRYIVVVAPVSCKAAHHKAQQQN